MSYGLVFTMQWIHTVISLQKMEAQKYSLTCSGLDKERIWDSHSAHSSLYSCLENSMDRGAWRVTVHGVAAELSHN